jgi:NAD(P) transhydrogenase subunit alpha
MHTIAVLKECHPEEKRIAITPSNLLKIKKLTNHVYVQKGLGEHLFISDEDYQNAGATIFDNPSEILSKADIILRVHKPHLEEISQMKKGSMYISFLDPFKEKAIIHRFQENGITALSLEMLPRTTVAQKMDGLSSQANLAGYVAVMQASVHLTKIFPMMTTPAGTLSSAKVFVLGVGVAGLQAIATAKRLGARVEAFDTRPVVEEQVKSLGGSFLKIDLGTTEATKEGYAKALTEEQLSKQKEALLQALQESDVVITTAQVFGKKAPILITEEMLKKMKKGSVFVDLAVDSGGNIEGSLKGVHIKHGLTLIGLSQPANYCPLDASTLYSSNLFHLLDHFWDKEKKIFKLDLTHELLKGCTLTHDNKIIHPLLQ